MEDTKTINGYVTEKIFFHYNINSNTVVDENDTHTTLIPNNIRLVRYINTVVNDKCQNIK